MQDEVMVKRRSAPWAVREILTFIALYAGMRLHCLLLGFAAMLEEVVQLSFLDSAFRHVRFK